MSDVFEYKGNLMDYMLSMRLQKPLEDYLDYLDRLTLSSLYLLEGCMDIFCEFEDQVHKVRGKDSVRKVWEARFECMPRGGFVIQDFAWGRKPACAYAQFSLRENSSFEGVLRIEFNEEGRVVLHKEYWCGDFPFQGKKYLKALDEGRRR